MVVQDTHPAPFTLPDSIRQVLLVRPTSFEYLLRLRKSHGRQFAAFLLCDAPDSPTWPYDDAQTRQLSRWKKWHVLGPVYRRPADEELREVRERNRIVDGEQVCVFTMGGGGVHEPR